MELSPATREGRGELRKLIPPLLPLDALLLTVETIARSPDSLRRLPKRVRLDGGVEGLELIVRYYAPIVLYVLREEPEWAAAMFGDFAPSRDSEAVAFVLMKIEEAQQDWAAALSGDIRTPLEDPRLQALREVIIGVSRAYWSHTITDRPVLDLILGAPRKWKIPSKLGYGEDLRSEALARVFDALHSGRTVGVMLDKEGKLALDPGSIAEVVKGRRPTVQEDAEDSAMSLDSGPVEYGDGLGKVLGNEDSEDARDAVESAEIVSLVRDLMDEASQRSPAAIAELEHQLSGKSREAVREQFPGVTRKAMRCQEDWARTRIVGLRRRLA